MMKIEPYHHDAMDSETATLLRDLTENQQGVLDERLVRLYWTYKARRDGDRGMGGPLKATEWRYLCMRLGIHKAGATLDFDVESVVTDLCGGVRAEGELRNRVVERTAFFEAVKNAPSAYLRAIEYELALAGAVSMPNHVRPTLHEWRERWTDLERARTEREQAMNEPERPVVEAPEPANEAHAERNGWLESISAGEFHDLVEHRKLVYPLPATIRRFNRTMTGKVMTYKDGKLQFKDDGTGRKYWITNIVVRDSTWPKAP